MAFSNVAILFLNSGLPSLSASCEVFSKSSKPRVDLEELDLVFLFALVFFSFFSSCFLSDFFFFLSLSSSELDDSEADPCVELPWPLLIFFKTMSFTALSRFIVPRASSRLPSSIFQSSAVTSSIAKFSMSRISFLSTLPPFVVSSVFLLFVFSCEKLSTMSLYSKKFLAGCVRIRVWGLGSFRFGDLFPVWGFV